MNYAEAFDKIKAGVRTDRELAWAWHCNLAMPCVDEGVSHDQANRAAARIMDLFFGVNTIHDPRFVATQQKPQP